MLLLNAGIVSYNGYTFDGASHVTLNCEPVYDEAQRVVIYHRYRLRVQAVIAEGSGTDSSLVVIRALLSKSGQALTVTNKGLGNLVVNSGGGVYDVDYGPKPQIIAWEPIGSLRACEVIWECDTSIAYCYSPLAAQGVLALNYGIDCAIDYRGMTTRTTSGYLEIAAHRLGTSISDTADGYRGYVDPPIPDRFRRSAQNFSVSPNKRRLDFSITDEEIYSYNAFPPGVVRIEGRHQANWSRRGGGAARLRNRLVMDIELAPTQDRLTAIAVFLAIAKQRILIAQARSQFGALIEDLTIEEGIFNGQASFAVTYVVYAALKDILSDTGIWVPVNSNWTVWKTSVESIYGRYGYAGLIQSATQDAIVDICDNEQPQWDEAVAFPAPDAPPMARVGLRNYPPHPYYSWLHYECHIVIFRGHTVVRHTVLQTPDPADQDGDPNDTEISWPASTGTPDIIQKSGICRYRARIYGWARRAGYPIPRPRLTKIGTATAWEIGGTFRCWIAGNWLGVPIYQAKWSIDYELETSPSTIQPPKNVKEGVAADGTADPPEDA